MKKIVNIRWECSDCQLAVDEDVSMLMQLKYEHVYDRMCAICGKFMIREFQYGEVTIGYKMGLDRPRPPQEAQDV